MYEFYIQVIYKLYTSYIQVTYKLYTSYIPACIHMVCLR